MAMIARLDRLMPDGGERLKQHMAQPQISASEHSWRRRLELGDEVMKKTRIYLDMKYWLYCRDAATGRQKSQVRVAIFEELRRLVGRGVVVCPASFPILSEIAKHKDREVRKKGALVIDELSRGVAIRPFFELIRTEVVHFVQSLPNMPDRAALRRSAWTYAMWIVGEAVLTPSAVDEAKNNAIAKTLFDYVSNLTFSEVLETCEPDGISPEIEGDFWYKQLNSNRPGPQDGRIFNVILSEKLFEALDTIREYIVGSWKYKWQRDSVGAIEPGSNQEKFVFAATADAIRTLFQKGMLTNQFPFVHIMANIHAAIDLRRDSFKKGDHWDHLHAHPALGYCDAFFTESYLGSMLRQRPLELDKVYGCRVISDDDEALDYLRGLGAAKP